MQVRPAQAGDLDEADRIMRLAFGTYLKMSDPLGFLGDADYVRSRFHADPGAVFSATEGGRLIGTSYANRWGSVGFLGPLTVHPDWWDRGAAQRLLEPVLERFSVWQTRLAGLFTFPNSPKHLSLYQKFGFWPRFLRPVLQRKIEAAEAARALRYSGLDHNARDEAEGQCAELTSAIYPGLDLRREIRSVQLQGLGDSLMLEDNRGIAGLAVCHCGPGSEVGSGGCYIKFAAVRCGPRAELAMEQLLTACAAFGHDNGATRLVAGVSTGRSRVYRQLLGLGFSIQQIGIAMHKPDMVGYDRDEVFVLDDWR